jgi:sialic acid synthase SpsE
VRYETTEKESESETFRRSLFVVEDVAEGEAFTEENVRSIRPGGGLHTRHHDDVLGATAAHDIERGTPMAWSLVSE